MKYNDNERINIKECANKMLLGDLEAKDKLIRHYYINIVSYVEKKYPNNNNNDDLIQAGCEGLLVALDTYKLNYKTPITIHIFRYINDFIEREIKLEPQNSNIDYIGLNNNYILKNDNYDDFIEKICNKDLIKNNFNKLSERQKEIVNLFFFKGYTKVKIAKIYNLTDVRISQILEKSIKILSLPTNEDKIETNKPLNKTEINFLYRKKYNIKKITKKEIIEKTENKEEKNVIKKEIIEKTENKEEKNVTIKDNILDYLFIMLKEHSKTKIEFMFDLWLENNNDIKNELNSIYVVNEYSKLKKEIHLKIKEMLKKVYNTLCNTYNKYTREEILLALNLLDINKRNAMFSYVSNLQNYINFVDSISDFHSIIKKIHLIYNSSYNIVSYLNLMITNNKYLKNDVLYELSNLEKDKLNLLKKRYGKDLKGSNQLYDLNTCLEVYNIFEEIEEKTKNNAKQKIKQ